MSASRLLSTYLRDHHAGSVAGLNLARRIARENEGNEYGAELNRIAGEIADDQQTLESLMEALGVSPDRLKDVAASAGEKLSRVMPNRRLISYSPLSRLLELETLELGVAGKLALWHALDETFGDTLGGTEIAPLKARADDQRARLAKLRLRAAAEALRSD